MKKTKKLFVIGDKTSKTRIIISLLIAPFVAGMLGFPGSFDLIYSNIFATIAWIIIIVLIGILQIPMLITSRQHWDISEDYLEYYAIDNYLQQWRYVISILKGREDVCAFKIKLTEIKTIKIYWNIHGAPYSTMSYSIYFGITLKDESIITFLSLVNSDKKVFLDAINYLKERYFIQIDDKYNVLGVLADPNQNLHEYIDKIERQKFFGGGNEG